MIVSDGTNAAVYVLRRQIQQSEEAQAYDMETLQRLNQQVTEGTETIARRGVELAEMREALAKLEQSDG